MRKETRPFGFGGWRWELLGDVRGRALEIGCGWGHNFDHYPSEISVSAFDVEMDRVREAARRGHSIRLAAADAQQLPFPDVRFDSVVATLVFCSIPDPAAALGEIRRVLKPDGRLYLIDHVRSHHHWLGRAQDFLAPAWLWATGGCNLNRDTESTVRRAGFEIEKLKVGFGGLLKLMVSTKGNHRLR
ncbi:MAG: class I SAM-dependent methyltransferase [Chloroflexi bacterium]|nr:class I SAM-dependent methyltransferase [Chloroflexota bacterium]